MKFNLVVATFKINSGSYGTDAAPTPAANWVPAVNVDINPLNMELDEYMPVSGKFGSGLKIVGAKWSTVSFEMHMAGGGTPLGNVSNLPTVDVIHRACGMARTVTAATNIIYNNIDTGEEDATMYFYVHGIMHKILGLRGSIEWVGEAGKAMRARFSGTGLWVPMVDIALPTPTRPTTPRPVAFNFSNTGITVDGGFTAKVLNFSINQGNDVQYRNHAGAESVDIMGRQMAGKMTLELPKVAEWDFMGSNGNVSNASPVALFCTHGTTAGNRVQFDLPVCQLLNPKYRKEKGLLMLDVDIHVVDNQLALIFT